VVEVEGRAVRDIGFGGLAVIAEGDYID
jgi:hypothetical protein